MVAASGPNSADQSRSASSVQRATASGEQKILRAVFLMNLVFVRQIVADGSHAEVARLDQRFDRLHHGRLERRRAGTCRARAPFLKISRHSRRACVMAAVTGLSVMRHEALRTSLRPARIAIHLDEPVVEIDRRIVLHPGNSERHPLRIFARLVKANQMADRFGLLRIGIGARFLQALVRLLQIRRIQPGGTLPSGVPAR